MVIRAAMSSTRTPRRRTKQVLWPYAFLLPTFVMAGVFLYYPAVSALYYSLTNWNGFNAPQFVGLSNYQTVVTSPGFWQGVGHLGLLTVAALLVSLSFPLVIAKLILMVRSAKVRSWFRVVFVIPMIIPGIVTILVWQYIFDPNVGLLNILLHGVGLNALTNTWLGNPNIALYCLMFIGFPWVSGFSFLVYLSGLQNVDQEIRDAALVDGASQWKAFWKIDLPLILGQIKLVGILTVIGTLQSFVMILILTAGGPANATMVPGLDMYQQAFSYSQFGVGMAIGTLIFGASLVLTVINMKYIRSNTEVATSTRRRTR